MTPAPDDRVSRIRYDRERAARAEAEALLETKSRQLFAANEALSKHSEQLEAAVKERTQELELAVIRAEAASTARSRFVATMSHEIRTPLGGLLGMIDLLSMDEVDATKLELLNYAKAAGSGLSRIVNDVLDFSKMEAGVFVFEEEHVDIRALAESARMLYGSHGKGVDRAILCQIDDSVPRLFLSDATRIRQIISNLLSNALRYSMEGPIVIRAKATPDPKGVLLRVEVQDFGIGIAADKIGSLFKDFSQVANPLTVAAQGTGLGLAICKRIVDGIGGRIGVETAPGKGSNFWFEVPVKVISLMDPGHGAASIKQDASREIDLTGKRVLIAEDNLINQRLLLAYSARMNLTADLAENGRVAFEKFEPGKYDLILMDIAMPEMDGLEATRRIREKWPCDSIPPIIALTAHVADAIEDEARVAGIDRILSKPIPFDELKLALMIALNPPRSTASDQPVDASSATPPPPSDIPLKDMFAPGFADELLGVLSLEELQDLAVKFVTDCRRRIGELTAADQSGNEKEVRAQAHSLKGACLALGFTEMAEWARRIELHDKVTGDEIVADLAARFAAEIARLDVLLARSSVAPAR